jgi:hypothetical protein
VYSSVSAVCGATLGSKMHGLRAESVAMGEEKGSEAVTVEERVELSEFAETSVKKKTASGSNVAWDRWMEHLEIITKRRRPLPFLKWGLSQSR